MLEARPNPPVTLKWLMVTMIGLIALEAGSQGRGSQASDLSPRVEKKIQIRVSVRPTLRIHKLPTLDTSTSLCLWSNIPAEKFTVRAELSDGRSSEQDMTGDATSACNHLGVPLVQAGVPPVLRTEHGSDTAVTLLITPE